MSPLLAAFQEHSGGAEHHGPPPSIFTPLYEKVKDTDFGKWMGFDQPLRHMGQMWFEGLCFSVIACVLLIVLALLATRRLEKVPRGLQNLFEMVVSGFRGMVGSMCGDSADKYVPFIGTAFLLIFTLNMLGIFPAGRSPTLALSITAGLGIPAFLLVQYYSFRDAGVVNVLKHLMGPVWWMAPLIFCAEVISELIRPVSLSMRLFGNIYGEDNVIEAFMGLADKFHVGWIPLQLPFLGLAMLTSFLQAYIFTMLCTYYISAKVVHEDHGEGHGHGGEQAAEGHGHGHHGAAKAAH